jgi:hypothetical protein
MYHCQCGTFDHDILSVFVNVVGLQIMGLHGAALVHGIFAPRGIVTLELKTLYGYGSSLFALVADAREGTHAQVDVRNYFIAGGHKPIDPPLIERVINTLIVAVGMNRNGSVNQTRALSHQLGDYVVGPCPQSHGTLHILGPQLTALKEECHALPLYEYRKTLKGDNDDHCQGCAVW